MAKLKEVAPSVEDKVKEELILWFKEELIDIEYIVGREEYVRGSDWRADIVIHRGRANYKAETLIAVECKGEVNYRMGIGQALSYAFAFDYDVPAGFAAWDISQEYKQFIRTLPIYGFDINENGINVFSKPGGEYSEFEIENMGLLPKH